jgi:replicative DNA helicase
MVDFGPASEARGRPRNVEAERSVLGSLLLDQAAIADVGALLRPDDFWVPKHRLLFQAILQVFEGKGQVDVLTVEEVLSREGVLDEVGGRDELFALLHSVVSAAGVSYHAEIVREKAIQRKLLETCEEIAERAYRNLAEPRELLDFAEEQIFRIARMDATGQIQSVDQLVQKVFERIDFFRSNKGQATGLMTGYRDLDEMTGGLQPGELVIVAARPSMGKTTFALNLCERIALSGKGVLIFSLEMSSQQIISNMLCCRAQVNGQAMRRGRITEEEYERLQHHAAKLYEAPIYVDDGGGLTPATLRSKCRRHRQQGNPLALVVVDYLQLMHGGQRIESRQQEIAHISRSMKALARELEIPVIALSQLNRDVEGREDHRPRMSDLRESGAIEQDADVIALLHREDYYKPTEENRGLAQLIVAKQRNGPTGDVTLQFFREYMRFENFAGKVEPLA